MGLQLHQRVWVPAPPSEVFAFFSDPGNLDYLTPPWLHFRILTPTPFSMRAGRIIDYRLRLRGIPVRWRSEITVWDPPHRFVDEQRRGPYRHWVHEHRFEATDEGTTVSDHVAYVPRGGALIHRYFVRPNLNAIFAFRRAHLVNRFGGVRDAEERLAALPCGSARVQVR